jgi:hypothetical protein
MSLTAPPQIPSTVPRRFRCCLTPQAGKTPTKHGVWRTSSSADLADKRRNLKPCLYQHVASAAVPEPIAHEPAVNRLVLTTEPQDPYERHIQDTATYSVHLAHRQLRCLISDTHDPQLDRPNSLQYSKYQAGPVHPQSINTSADNSTRTPLNHHHNQNHGERVRHPHPLPLASSNQTKH